MKINLETILKQSYEKLVLIDFFAEWCAPCMQLMPIIEALEKEFPGVCFYRLDVEEYKGIANEYNVRAIPFLLFLKDGKKVDEMVGNQSKGLIIERINILHKG